jgi:hypothetical protein
VRNEDASGLHHTGRRAADRLAARDRLEALLVSGENCPLSRWREAYVDDPVVGVWGRSLIWEVRGPGGAWTAGWPSPERDGVRLVDPAGVPLDVPADATVRLWHPMRATDDAVSAWRDFLAEREGWQPFKQAYREVYVLDRDQVAGRFEGHILRRSRALALMESRGWRGLELTGADVPEARAAGREIAGGTWRVQLGLRLEQYNVTAVCVTERLAYQRRDGEHWVDAEPTEVPPLVLSETLRDVDLFVSAASIAHDRRRPALSTPRHRGYWEQASFGPLAESAVVRRAALARILPGTRIADRVTIADRYLRVRGDLRVYNIHLGSGNVLMEPNDAYLCFDSPPDRDGPLFLPFEEDGGLLAMILSKAFLLAADTTITNPALLAQINA